MCLLQASVSLSVSVSCECLLAWERWGKTKWWCRNAGQSRKRELQDWGMGQCGEEEEEERMKERGTV